MLLRLGCWLTFTLAAPAQSTLSLQDAVQKALDSNAQVTAASERIFSAQGLRAQAALRLNPRLFIQSENEPFSSFAAAGPRSYSFGRDVDNYAYIAQQFEVSGKRARRTELADANLHRFELERQSTTRQIRFRVRTAYWDAVAAQATRDLLREESQNYQQIVDYNAARAKEGVIAEVDLIRVQIERDRNLINANNAALEADRARIELLRSMGQSEFPALQLSEELTQLPKPNAPDDLASALENRPDIRLAHQAVRAAEANLRLQHALVHPDPQALFGYKRTAGYNTLIAGVQIDLPFLNRNQGQIAFASGEVRATQALLAATQAVARAEISAARSEYDLRLRQVTTTLDPLRARALESSRIARAAYREGGLDLLRLLDAERVRLEVQQIYLRALADLQKSAVALENATGVNP